MSAIDSVLLALITAFIAMCWRCVVLRRALDDAEERIAELKIELAREITIDRVSP